MDEECSMCGKRNTYSVLVGTSYWKDKMDCEKARYEGVEWSDHGQDRASPSAVHWL